MFIGTTATRNRSYGDTTWRRRLPMTLSRRNALKLGLGAGASALLPGRGLAEALSAARRPAGEAGTGRAPPLPRSGEHTSEIQSQSKLLCRLLLEKKKTDTGYS